MENRLNQALHLTGAAILVLRDIKLMQRPRQVSLGVRKAMMREIKDSDWKILRQLHSHALERFCKQILLEVERISSDNSKSFHQKYLNIYEIMQRRDKEMAQTFNDVRRSTALAQLAAMKSRDLLTEEEFSRFSQETQNVVALLLGN